jgi:hypothetical protein
MVEHVDTEFQVCKCKNVSKYIDATFEIVSNNGDISIILCVLN